MSQLTGKALVSIISDSEVVYDRDGTMTQGPLYPMAVKRLRWERMRMALLGLAREWRARQAGVGAGSTARWDMAMGNMERDLERHQEKATLDSPEDDKGTSGRRSFTRRRSSSKLGRTSGASAAAAAPASAAANATDSAGGGAESAAGSNGMLEVDVTPTPDRPPTRSPGQLSRSASRLLGLGGGKQDFSSA